MPTENYELKKILTKNEQNETNVGNLFLIRHGETIASDTQPGGGFFAGWRNVPLSEAGEADAKAAGKLLKELMVLLKRQIDIAFTSDLQRAQKTLEYALGEMELSHDYTDLITLQRKPNSYGKKIPIIITPDLKERHYGALVGKGREEFKNELEGAISRLLTEKPDLENATAEIIAAELSANWQKLTQSSSSLAQNGGISLESINHKITASSSAGQLKTPFFNPRNFEGFFKDGIKFKIISMETTGDKKDKKLAYVK